MEFCSLHTYLEHCFANKQKVSDQMVQQAKQDYRKIYVAKYQKQYRQDNIQISFRISKKQYQIFQEQAKHQNVKTNSYIKQLVLQKQGNTNPNSNIFNRILLEAIDIIEEAIQEERIVHPIKILTLLEQLQEQL